MKKTFWSLAALMLMAAPVMTSCSNDLDEATPIEEVKSNVVTITIAPPAASRVAMGPDGLTIAGWEEGDVVTVYKATPGVGEDLIKGIEEAPAKVVGEGLTMTCTDPSAGTFSGTLADGEKIDDYNLAIFGGTTENYWDDFSKIGGINIKPTTWSSTELKDVVMMGAIKEGQSFTMKIINNVMKIENAAASDIEAAWYGYDSSTEENSFFELASQLATLAGESWAWKGYMINDQSNSWATVPHITLAKNAINYVNFPMIYSVFDEEDKIGLYMSDETAVVPMKSVEGRISDGYSSTYCGRLINAGTYTGSTGGTVDFDKNNSNVSWNGTGTSTLTATDSQSNITLTLARSSGNITRNSISGNITFATPQADQTMTVSVSGGKATSVTYSGTGVVLVGAGPWTLTYKTTAVHSVPSNGWYTSGGDAFIPNTGISGTKKLTVVYE